MKSIIKSLFMCLISLVVLSGCSLFGSGSSENNSNTISSGSTSESTNIPTSVSTSTNTSSSTSESTSTSQVTSNSNNNSTSSKHNLTIKDLGNVTFKRKVFLYDKEEHSILLDGTLPEGMKVTYKDNKQIEPGKYTATATIIDTTGKLSGSVTLYAQLIIDYSLSIIPIDTTTAAVTRKESNGNNLEEIEIYDEINGYKIVEIANNAFENCSILKSVIIPSSIKSINDDAFIGCYLLENIYYNGTIEDWCNITFKNELSNPMIVSRYMHEQNSNPKLFKNHFYVLNSDNEYEEVTNIEIPNTITNVGFFKFGGFDNVTSVTIPNSITKISYAAFWFCESLTNITLPSSLKTLETGAFAFCKSLTSITIPNSVTTIGNYAFEYCTSLTIYCEASSEPSGWNSSWNYSNCEVVWGYNG